MEKKKDTADKIKFYLRFVVQQDKAKELHTNTLLVSSIRII